MIKVEVTKEFTLGRFDEIKNIKRIGRSEIGRLYVGDVFECNNDLCEYLLGNNRINSAVVKVIEVIPEFKDEHKEKVVEEEKPKKSTKKKSSKK